MSVSLKIQAGWDAPAASPAPRTRTATHLRLVEPTIAVAPVVITPDVARLPEHLLRDIGLEPHMVARPLPLETLSASLRFLERLILRRP
ncbi:hypothetical protein [Gellertiella hungarica]|uniref:Uncharacterized protein n=1 Tax=Gellertiella hungarica TaxID=1572859 RepID=A0A7W6J8Y8_9HYPH|nr:hypothetical protein [Gellertiella hungarica]MBB4066994.1 hypothetical protein [Gellertiella hungarica]